MKRSLGLVAAFLFFSLSQAVGQQRYDCTLILKFGDIEKGFITVNLDGANDDLVLFEASTSSTKKKDRTTTTQSVASTAKYNVAIISSLSLIV